MSITIEDIELLLRYANNYIECKLKEPNVDGKELVEIATNIDRIANYYKQPKG